MSNKYIVLAIAFFGGAINAQERFPAHRADAHAVMAQFIGIVAQGLALVASSGDKEAQLHALSNIVQGVAHIVELARDSDEAAAKYLEELNRYRHDLNEVCGRRKRS